MVGTIAIALAKARPFENQTIFQISKGRISDPHCVKQPSLAVRPYITLTWVIFQLYLGPFFNFKRKLKESGLGLCAKSRAPLLNFTIGQMLFKHALTFVLSW